MTAKIRLLWYFPSFELEGMYPGGYRTLAIARALIRNGVSHISIASILLKKSAQLDGSLELVALPRNPLLIWKSLINLIITRHINVVQERLDCGYLWNGWGIFAGKICNLPTIGELHQYPTILAYPLYMYALTLSDKLFVINPIIMEYLPKSVEFNKIVGISNGYDDSILPRNTLKTGLKCDPFIKNKRIIGYFGRLGKEKGVDIILDLIRETPDNYFFIVSGRGPLEDEMRHLSQVLPEKCKYLSLLNQKAVYHYMAVCDATLALYSPELKKGRPQCGSPLKVYESLAVGTPVVISKATLSMLPPEVANLCVVASEINLKELLNSLDIACRQKFEKRSTFTTVLQKYSWDYIAKNSLIPIYETLISNSG